MTSEREKAKTATDEVIEELIFDRVSEILQDLGIPAHLKGYRYARHAISLLVEDSAAYDNGVTKVLYPEVAKEFSTTATRVERAVRHAIEEGCTGIMEQYFGNSMKGKKPSNSQFLYTIADKIKREFRLN